MILQAHEYEQAQAMPLEEFFRSTAGAWLSPAGTALALNFLSASASTPSRKRIAYWLSICSSATACVASKRMAG